jgi:hypothetical protein
VLPVQNDAFVAQLQLYEAGNKDTGNSNRVDQAGTNREEEETHRKKEIQAAMTVILGWELHAGRVIVIRKAGTTGSKGNDWFGLWVMFKS